MKPLMRGLAVLLTTAALLIGSGAFAQDKTLLATDREKTSYAIGMDVGGSILQVGPDLDLAAFERATKAVFAGEQPLLSAEEAREVERALMARIDARAGKAPAGGEIPEVARDKVGYLVGTGVSRSLLPIKDELELPVLLQALRTTLDGDPPLLSAEEVKTTLTAFGQRMQGQMQAKAQAAAETNRAAGVAFLASNKAVKGVFTTPSGLQYMVLRQGAGARPLPSAQVRVNYHGTLLDGTVFESSYERGQPVEFSLNQVIPGWTEGVAMMPVGAKYRFWIPGELAYGAKGAAGMVGPNATLVFDVELLAILD